MQITNTTEHDHRSREGQREESRQAGKTAKDGGIWAPSIPLPPSQRGDLSL
jgi:hypothetical protein